MEALKACFLSIKRVLTNMRKHPAETVGGGGGDCCKNVKWWGHDDCVEKP